MTLWDQLPADLLLREERDGWRTILKDVQKRFNDNVYMPVCTYVAIDYEVHRKKIGMYTKISAATGLVSSLSEPHTGGS